MGRLFYVAPEEADKGEVLLDEGESRHALSVLRLKKGEGLKLFDGKGHVFHGEALGVKEKRLWVRIRSRSENPPSSASAAVTLAASVVKPERMDFLIQKSCELGVGSIEPLLTERTVVRLSRERWEAKLRHWQGIAMEACKQCGLSVIPEIRPARDYDVFLASVSPYPLILIPTLAVKGRSLYEAIKGSKPDKVLCLIGPEGDFTKREADLAVSHGAVPVSLGPLVMRSETAAVYLVSALSFYYREVRGR
ncbi:MAG: 16S rRNA (uracil(1498)-N(3))-methyltransferase [Candidatus Omnitrophica bacterium]|nr:16S rRNA (uracil(1498)-N(3))-methyltransferase [Candidatus Omnitrophota bacterium]